MSNYTLNILLRFSSAVPLDMMYMTSMSSRKEMRPSLSSSYMLKILFSNSFVLSSPPMGKHCLMISLKSFLLIQPDGCLAMKLAKCPFSCSL